MAGKKKRLGRGLDGLLPAAPAPVAKSSVPTKARVEELHPNKKQPRTHFDEVALTELSNSIAEQGVLVPIVVRNRPEGEFEIIAGERRWRAAQRAGVLEVPICVLDLNDARAFEAALVENLQRQDLNPLETARAYKRLVDDYGYTQDRVAQRVGKDRSSVSNALRLLRLPEEILSFIERGELSEGHGRALLQAPDPSVMMRLARAARDKKLSVREVERQARGAKTGAPIGAAKAKQKSANVLDLERRLTHAMGASVSVDERAKGRGTLQIAFTSYDELDRVIEKLLG